MDNTELFLIPLNVTPAESDVAALERKRAALARDSELLARLHPSIRESFAALAIRRADDRLQLGIFGYPAGLDPSWLQNLVGAPLPVPGGADRETGGGK